MDRTFKRLIKFNIFKGWRIELNSDYEYNVYISPPGLNYPTYSSLFTVPYLSLQKRNTVFVRFSAENYRKIRKRGLLDSRIYCNENSNPAETVSCAKACFLKSFNVSIKSVFKIECSVSHRIYCNVMVF